MSEHDSDTHEDILTITEQGEDKETVYQVKENHNSNRQLYARLMMNKKLINFQKDCGAICNMIPLHLLNTDVQLEKSEKVLVMYNKTKLHTPGKCKIKIRNPRNNKLYRLEFQVVDQEDRTPLFGRRAGEGMQLIKVQYENILTIDSIMTKVESTSTREEMTLEKIKTEFEDIFTGDGCLEGEYKIEIDENVPPVKLPKRRVPVAMITPLKEELKNLEERGIITPKEKKYRLDKQHGLSDKTKW